MQHFRTFCLFLTYFIVFCFFAHSAHAVPLIRDAEIEYTLRQYADPILKAAGVNPAATNIFIVNDDALNAYVAGGANMFLHTGLIKACATPDMLLGVMAHETGHIAGGHLARGAEQLKQAQLGTILSFVLGAAAGVASRDPGAAATVIAGGQTSVLRNFLSFTRAHEEAADQSAMNSLDKLAISANGLLKILTLLERERRAHPDSPDPYLLTHPLTSIRIDFVRNHVMQSNIPETQYPKTFDLPHKRMLAKLYGFLESPERTLMKYPLSDKSVPARLAQAVAYYKMPDLEKSLATMDALLAQAPEDPFFNELKGQILFENGRVADALVYYEKAVKLLPNSALILTDLGKVELAQPAPRVQNAIVHLEKAINLDRSNPGSWRFLSAAYGRAGNAGMSALALAEEAIIFSDGKTAARQANIALKSLQPATPAYQRALDVQSRAAEMQRSKKDDDKPF